MPDPVPETVMVDVETREYTTDPIRARHGAASWQLEPSVSCDPLTRVTEYGKMAV
ncbi:hypothetical protein F183_A55190 (plasmid) [Bryobacterales bacterium F-183]|nr:hypothetical protein F183_A55190 [Bryobacterales bacterium F-183]